MITINEIEAGEIEIIRKVDKNTQEMIYLATKWQVMKNDRVMKDEGKIVATAFFNITKYRDYVNLFWIIVLPEYRGMGYGRKLIDEIMKMARNAGKKFMIFKCKVTGEEKKFYDKLGFLPDRQEGKEFIYKITL